MRTSARNDKMLMNSTLLNNDKVLKFFAQNAKKIHVTQQWRRWMCMGIWITCRGFAWNCIISIIISKIARSLFTILLTGDLVTVRVIPRIEAMMAETSLAFRTRCPILHLLFQGPLSNIENYYIFKKWRVKEPLYFQKFNWISNDETERWAKKNCGADRIISREGAESWNLISGNLATKWWVSFSILTGNKHDFGACAPVNKNSMNKETLYPSKRRSALDSFRIYNSVADIDSLEVDKPDGNSIYIQSHRLTVANMRFTGNSMF